MKSICGADCTNCGYGKNAGCRGCQASGGCPFGKQCFIAKYIQTGGLSAFDSFKKQLIFEFNALHIEGMPEITELCALNGAFVNPAYPMPNGHEIKLLDDNEIYLGTQHVILMTEVLSDVSGLLREWIFFWSASTEQTAPIRSSSYSKGDNA